MILLQLRGHPNSRPGKSKIGKVGREEVASEESVREGAGNFCCPRGVQWELCVCVYVCLFYFYKCPAVKAVCGLGLLSAIDWQVCMKRETGGLGRDQVWSCGG